AGRESRVARAHRPRGVRDRGHCERQRLRGDRRRRRRRVPGDSAARHTPRAHLLPARRDPAVRRSQPAYLAPGLLATTTNATTSLICFDVSAPTNVGITPLPPPESAFMTRAAVRRLLVSTGPAFALFATVPAGFSVWQLPHFALKTALPATGLPVASAGAARPSATATTASARTCQPSVSFATIGCFLVAFSTNAATSWICVQFIFFSTISWPPKSSVTAEMQSEAE